jgi:O-antigen/teichoic acid export membrane protein
VKLIAGSYQRIAVSRSSELAKSAVSNLLSQGVMTVSSIAYIAYFARAFSEKQMAVYAMLNVMIGWNDLATAGFSALLNKDAALLITAGESQKFRSLFSSVVFYRTITLLLICQCWFFASPLIARYMFKDNSYMHFMYYAPYISIAAVVRSMLSGAQSAVQRFTSRSTINVVTGLSQQALSVGGYFAYDVTGFLSGFLAGSMLGIILCCVDLKSYFTLRLKPFSELFRESRPYMVLQFLDGAIDRLDRPVVGFFLGAEALAAYHIARRLYENLYTATSTILEPVVVKFGEVLAEGQESLNRYYRQAIIVTGHIFFPLGFFMILAGKPLLSLYGGAKYTSSYPVVMAFGFTLLGISMWSTLRAAGLRLLPARYLAYQTIISYVVTIAGYLFLLPVIGTAGIPIAMGVGYFAGWTLESRLRKQWGTRTPWKDVCMTFGCGLTMLVALVPMSFFRGSMVKLVVACAFSGIIYLAWTHLIGPKEIDMRLRRIYATLPLGKVWTSA